MTWPSSDVNTTNADAGTDSPATFRTDVLDLLTKFNLLRNHVSSFMQGVLSAATAATARASIGAAASGANIDITSITGNAATATNVAYSGLTGTVPTWNQNTTGSAASLSAAVSLINGSSAITQASTDSSAFVATNQFVQSATIGNGSALVVPGYSPNTTYNNGTGRPRLVSVCIGSSVGNAVIDLMIGATVAARAYQTPGGAGMYLSAIVPAGANYGVQALTGTITNYQWAEVR